MKQISTTALASAHNTPTKELFAQLLKLGYIEKEQENWVLTAKGEEQGGSYKDSKRYGKHIVWPENIEISSGVTQTKLITSTAIGKNFELSANKVNFILSELGWVKKAIKGWNLTTQGKKLGGVQSEDKKSGIPYVRWPESIIKAKSLIETINHVKGKDDTSTESSNNDNKDLIEFREKFPAKHRTTDGHMVRSKAEMLIDNWLYMAEIVHAYERKLPIEEDMYCDFYIPAGKVYIEYWGYENNPKYLARKKEKIALYKKNEFNLIELQDKDIQNLDDVLPRMLLKHGVQAY